MLQGPQSFFGTAQGKKVTFRDTDDMNIDAVIKSTVESVAENTTVGRSHLFLVCDFGGLGGILYRTVNIIDNTVGYKQTHT